MIGSRIISRRIYHLMVICSVVIFTIAAAADEPQVKNEALVSNQAQCELHVFPSDGLQYVHHSVKDGLDTSYMGVFGTNAWRRLHSDSYPSGHTGVSEIAPLGTAEQRAILEQIALPETLGLPDYRMIVHITPIDSHTIRTNRTRYVISTAPCYAELVLDDVILQQAYADGTNLRIFFRFRQFGANSAPIWHYATWVQHKLPSVSRKAAVTGEVALAELRAAFNANTADFARLLENVRSGLSRRNK